VEDQVGDAGEEGVQKGGEGEPGSHGGPKEEKPDGDLLKGMKGLGEWIGGPPGRRIHRAAGGVVGGVLQEDPGGAAEQGEGPADVIGGDAEGDGGDEEEEPEGPGEGWGEEEGDPSGGEDGESGGGGGAEAEDVMIPADRLGDVDTARDPQQWEEFVKEGPVAEGAESEQVDKLVEEDPDREGDEGLQVGAEIRPGAEGLKGLQVGGRDRWEDKREEEAP
jgi:hypothetical protein